MRHCPRCNKNKDSTEFNKKKNGLSPYCRQCNSEYLKEHYKKNRKYYIEKKDKLREKNSGELAKYKEENPCTDCKKYFHFAAMDFDHVRGNKVANISILIRQGNSAQVREELTKCELVCSNCHRIRTWKRYRSPVV